MTSSLTFDSLTVSMQALRLLAVDFPHLPAPDVDVSPLDPERLRLSFHDTSCESLAAFEQWRMALGIASDAVAHSFQSEDRTRVLKAEGLFAGAVVVLTAFADVPAAEGARQAGGAA
ncbi:hypothetical protein [Streptomyces violaceus]|uniref:Uncharacterized protein n=1 Tax=Streptomyces violaceus TaxID=1936 RepID=A0ABY9UC22_STRVL|nr:hypothetical protein [Streptomyces janthinus]WND19796.1 hypothetical protein RI060_21635 [Streptomyces janthinus]GGS92478.1 hypothetical protein GCM10010270_75790 [Streptomyces janthinus]